MPVDPDLEGFARVFTRPAWMSDAACRGLDVDLFFLDRGAAGAQHAKAVCKSCPVRHDCKTYAIDNGEKFGVWGGTVPLDRRRSRRC